MRTYWGPVLVRSTAATNDDDPLVARRDSEHFYHCPIRKEMLPIPTGFTIPFIEDDKDPFSIRY